MRKTVYCGLMRRELDGKWYYGETYLGRDGEPMPGAFQDAVAASADCPEHEIPERKAPPVQMAFDWPVEEQRIAVDENETLVHAHRQLWAQLDAGTWCPCCQRSAKRQPRHIHGEMLEFLIKLVRAYAKQKRWYTMEELIPGIAPSPKHSSDASYFVPWGLLRRHPEQRGKYQPLPMGIAFVRGRTTVPRIAYVYNARATHFSREMVSIREAVSTVRKENKREELLRLLREMTDEEPLR